MSIKRRLAKLEAAAPAPHEPKYHQLIGTQLIATDDPALIGTNSTTDTLVTFYNTSKAKAYADRVQWLEGKDRPKNAIVMVCPRDNGERVIDVLKEKHGG